MLPDGSRKEVEEEVPEEEPVTEKEVTRRQVHRVYQPDPNREEKKKPKPVERVYVTRVIRKPDGIEHLIDESETVFPLEVTPEEQAPETVEEEEKDTRGVVIRRVVRRPVMVTTKRTVIRRTEVLPDGKEKEIEKSVEEAPKQEEEPRKTRRVVRKVTKEPTGQEKVVEEPAFVSPLESSTTEESEPEVEEKRVKGQVIRTVRRRSVKTSQRRVVRRVVEEKDGRTSDKPVEDTIEEPVEPTKYTLVRRTVIKSDGTTETVEEPQYEMPVESEPSIVEEEKNRRGEVTRRVVRRPVPVITRRRVYRKIILAPDGSEKGVEEKVEEPAQPAMPSDEEPIVAPMVVDEQESVPDMFGEEPGEDGVVRRTVTVRKRIVRKIIVLPDGSRKEVEEVVPLELEGIPCDEAIVEAPLVVDEQESSLEDMLDSGSGNDFKVTFSRKVFREASYKTVVPVERRIVRKVIKYCNGEEKVLCEEDVLVPLLNEKIIVPSDDDKFSIVSRKIVTKRILKFEDGTEENIDETVETESERTDPGITKEQAYQLRIERGDGIGPIIEEPVEVSPLEYSYCEYEPDEVESETVEKGKAAQIIIRRGTVSTTKEVRRSYMYNKKDEPVIVDLVTYPTEKQDLIEPREAAKAEQEPTILREEKNEEGVVLRRIVRRPIPVVTKRTVYRTLVLNDDGQETQFETSQEEPPVESRNILKRIISSVKPKVPVKHIEDTDDKKPEEVERHLIDRVIKHEDGEEELIDQYELISSLESPAVKVEPVTKRITDRKGRVIKTEVIRRVYVTVKTIVVRKVVEYPDGTEVELTSSTDDSPDDRKEEAPYAERAVIHRVVPQDRPTVVEETEDISPLETSFKKGDESKVIKETVLDDGSVEKTVTIKSEITKKKLITRKTTEYPKTMKPKVEEPVEEIIEHPVESGSNIEFTESIEEVKNKKGNVVKRIIHKEKPVQTRRMVYKKLLFTPEEGEQIKLDEMQPSFINQTPQKDDGKPHPTKDDTKQGKKPLTQSNKKPTPTAQKKQPTSPKKGKPVGEKDKDGKQPSSKDKSPEKEPTGDKRTKSPQQMPDRSRPSDQPKKTITDIEAVKKPIDKKSTEKPRSVVKRPKIPGQITEPSSKQEPLKQDSEKAGNLTPKDVIQPEGEEIVPVNIMGVESMPNGFKQEPMPIDIPEDLLQPVKENLQDKTEIPFEANEIIQPMETSEVESVPTDDFSEELREKYPTEEFPTELYPEKKGLDEKYPADENEAIKPVTVEYVESSPNDGSFPIYPTQQPDDKTDDVAPGKTDVVLRRPADRKRNIPYNERKESIKRNSMPLQELFIKLGRHDSGLTVIWDALLSDLKEEHVTYDEFMTWLTFLEKEYSTAKLIPGKFAPLQKEEEYNKVQNNYFSGAAAR